MSVALLEKILSQPTAPFREVHVIRTIKAILDRKRIPYFEDQIGNLVLGVSSPKEYRRKLALRTKEPLRHFIAHLDHPGFHGVRWLSPRRLKIRWFGGSPNKRLNGTQVWLADKEKLLTTGTLSNVKMNSPKGRGRYLGEAEVRLDRKLDLPAPSLFGSFAFRKPFWKQGKIIYTKAADDLVSAAIILQIASQKKLRKNFIGLLTRAEEVGFLGAIAFFKEESWKKAKRPLLSISLETSRQLPGAQIGKGPVLRLGDRFTVFESGSLHLAEKIAKKTLKDRYQKRIMDGGTCEATVTTSWGIPTIGISVPLGNYHNQSFEGGPDSRGPNAPAPEFVHLDDVAGMKKLSEALLSPGQNWSDPWKDSRKNLKKLLKKAKGEGLFDYQP